MNEEAYSASRIPIVALLRFSANARCRMEPEEGPWQRRGEDVPSIRGAKAGIITKLL